MEDRKRILEAYAKQLSEGNPLAEEFVDTSRKLPSQSIQARNLAEESLAHQVLKNTGIPIPNDGVSRLKKEDFLNQIMKERYPELEPNVSLNPHLGKQGLDGQYLPDKSKILLNDKQGILQSTGNLLHESGHQYDDKILGFDGDNNFKSLKQNAPAGKLLQDIDPMQMSEIMNKGHHANIPNLRDADSYGLGALKSMMKSGTFKQIAGALPVVGGLAAATMSGDASAAVPLLDEADDVGMSADDEKAMLNEHDARVNYDNSPARQAKMDALKKMGR